MNKVLDQVRSADAGVLVVTMTRPEMLRLYLSGHPWTFPLVGDPERKAYQAIGLDRTSVWGLLNPRVILHYLSLMFRGWLIRMPKSGEDTMQLGGDFVIDRERRLLFAHRTRSPADRPRIPRVLEALRQPAKG